MFIINTVCYTQCHVFLKLLLLGFNSGYQFLHCERAYTVINVLLFYYMYLASGHTLCLGASAHHGCYLLPSLTCTSRVGPQGLLQELQKQTIALETLP